MNAIVSQIKQREITQTQNSLIQSLRILLILSALLITLIDRSQPGRISRIVILTLVLYALYSILLHIFTRRDTPFSARAIAWAHWGDVGWCNLLIALDGGQRGVFFLGLLFAILIASFRWGFASGLRVTVFSALSFATMSVGIFHASGANFRLTIDLLKSAWLLLIGYIIAHWGGLEITLRRRLELLTDIPEYSNPRFGIDRTIGSIMERLRRFYGAQSCLIITSEPAGARMRRTSVLDPEAASRSEPIDPELAGRFLDLHPDYAAVHNAKREGWIHLGKTSQVLDLELGRLREESQARFAGLAAMLDAKSFVAVPLRFPNGIVGRLFLEARKPVFVPSDMRFLLHFLDHISPAIENIHLIERVTTHAADDERDKIARDIHDRVVQPYVGIQMALQSICAEAAGRFPQLAQQVETCMGVAQSAIADLRNYIIGLKGPVESDGGLLPAMHRLAREFSSATGIAVDVEVEGDIHANDRLAAETFHMMTEGLSNIRKHTEANRATVRLACRGRNLRLEIANENPKHASATSFMPRSIGERASALGGRVHVRSLPDGGTSVVVEIPL